MAAAKIIMTNNFSQQIKAVLIGVGVGDALGVPVEFKKRDDLKKNPLDDMTGFGTYYQPPGTFSDDSSLTFCLAEALALGFDTKLIGRNFFKWFYGNYWTAHGRVFDIGHTTRYAIERIATGVNAENAGATTEDSNGNGSLMRIAPLMFYLLDKPEAERFSITQKVSSITHGHIRSAIACYYYLEMMREIFCGKEKFAAYHQLKNTIPEFLESMSVPDSEIRMFASLTDGNIYEAHENNILSSGYVIHTLEAAMWCLLNSNSFQETVLKAVNLGSDTDTTGAVAGGLAGLIYGVESIPEKWIAQLARSNDILNLAERLAENLTASSTQ